MYKVVGSTRTSNAMGGTTFFDDLLVKVVNVMHGQWLRMYVASYGPDVHIYLQPASEGFLS